MKNTKELQEEFELLIQELERLKTINEITFENANNSKRTIEAIESLVSAMELFKKRVESDYKAKSEELAQLQNTIKDVISSLESNVEEQTTRFEKIANSSIKSVQKSNEEFQEKTNQTLGDFTNLSIEALSKQQLSMEKSSAMINSELIKIREAIDINDSSLRQIHENSVRDIELQFKSISSQLKTGKKRFRVLLVLLILTMILVAASAGITFIY